MAQDFELNPIRNLNADGSLATIGLEWTEEASWRYSNRLLFYFMGFPVVALWVFFGFVAMMAGGGIFILGSGLAIAFVMHRYLWGPLPRRSVVLRRDGKVLVPYGIPANKKARSLRASQGDVVGFEIGPSVSGMPNDWTSSVQAVTKSGATVTIGKVLHREEAREVVVGLNMALHEMRTSVGGGAARPTRRGTTPTFVD